MSSEYDGTMQDKREQSIYRKGKHERAITAVPLRVEFQKELGHTLWALAKSMLPGVSAFSADTAGESN